MFKWLKKLTGDPTARTLDAIQPLVDEINALGADLRPLPDEEIRARGIALRNRVRGDEDIAAARRQLEEKQAEIDASSEQEERMALREEWKVLREALFQQEQRVLGEVLPEAFALVREAARRTIGQVHFDSQLRGGIVLHQGQIAEMRTGEGKTLTATLPLYLNALAGHGAHLVTVNDYLARRDCGWMGEIFYFLGLNTAVVIPDFSGLYDPEYITEQVQGHDERLMHLRPCSRQEAYQADITYGTNNELGFDYLRDNMTHDLGDVAQREHYYAIVDEVDNILIDEARTPLIISAPDEESFKEYIRFARIVNTLEPGDYEIEEKERIVTLTDQGVDRVEQRLQIDRTLGQSLYDPEHAGLTYFLDAALKARFLYKKDVHYVVRESEVVIVDEFTGRLMPGRRWSDGIHESIEAREREIYREKVEIQRESKTYATVTFQNYFRLYQKLAGMSGTAATEQEEFFKIYYLEVVVIPTHKPMIRDDAPDRIYAREEVKLRAVVREVLRCYCLGRPVLVGTTSVAVNERLAGYLERKHLPLAVLMPLLARALRAADLDGASHWPMDDILAEPMDSFGSALQNLAQAALRSPDTLREADYARAAEQIERLAAEMQARQRRQGDGAGDEREDTGDRRARDARARKERESDRAALRQALREGLADALEHVAAMLGLDDDEEVRERLRRAFAEGLGAQVLNAKQHDREALFIARAGQKSAVTIATNMAGRGVDIILGGDPTQRAYERLQPLVLDREKTFARIVEVLLEDVGLAENLPRLRGYLPAGLVERLRVGEPAGVERYLREVAGWMGREVAEAEAVRERLGETALARVVHERVTARYPELPPALLGELIAAIDKVERGKPFERQELNAWASERGLAHLADEAVNVLRQVLRGERSQIFFRLQAEFAVRFGLAATPAREFAERVLRVGRVPTRDEIVRWSQEAGVPRYVVEETWHEYRYVVGVSLPEREKEVVTGRLYTVYMNAFTALIRTVLGGQHEQARAVIAAVPVLPAFFIDELDQVRAECERNRDEVRALGGLQIVGTERHEARRIDNQLRGRAGRLGDPGYTQFYVSTEDELMRRFGPGADRMRAVLERFAPDEEVPLEARMVSRMIEQAQVRVEGHNFDIRKHLVQYDDVLNRQRDVVYAERRRTLETTDPHGLVLSRLREEISTRVEDALQPLRGRREYDRSREAVYQALEELLEGLQMGRIGRETTRMPLYPAVNHLVVEGLRQEPAIAALERLQQARRLRAEDEAADGARGRLAEASELAQQAGLDEAAVELNGALDGGDPEETEARLEAAGRRLERAAEEALRTGLEGVVEALLSRHQEQYEQGIVQAIARHLEAGQEEDSGLYLTRLYRELTRARGLYLPPSVSTAHWMEMAPEEIEEEVLQVVRQQLAEELPRSRQRILERVSRAVREWSQGEYDWLFVERFLDQHRTPTHLAAEPLLEIFSGDLSPFEAALREELALLAASFLEEREERLGSELLRQIERRYLLEAIDKEWVDYLTAMEELRQGIGLRAYGQQDPLVEYRRESYHLFERLMERVRERSLFYILASAQMPVRQRGTQAAARAAAAGPAETRRPAEAAQPASSGKKRRKRRRK